MEGCLWNAQGEIECVESIPPPEMTPIYSTPDPFDPTQTDNSASMSLPIANRSYEINMEYGNGQENSTNLSNDTILIDIEPFEVGPEVVLQVVDKQLLQKPKLPTRDGIISCDPSVPFKEGTCATFGTSVACLDTYISNGTVNPHKVPACVIPYGSY